MTGFANKTDRNNCEKGHLGGNGKGAKILSAKLISTSHEFS
jgi:hypothetical protein